MKRIRITKGRLEKLRAIRPLLVEAWDNMCRIRTAEGLRWGEVSTETEELYQEARNEVTFALIDHGLL